MHLSLVPEFKLPALGLTPADRVVEALVDISSSVVEGPDKTVLIINHRFSGIDEAGEIWCWDGAVQVSDVASDDVLMADDEGGPESLDVDDLLCKIELALAEDDSVEPVKFVGLEPALECRHSMAGVTNHARGAEFGWPLKLFVVVLF